MSVRLVECQERYLSPYRERVSRNRLKLLNFDLHPIAIHLSQALVIAIPVLVIITNLSKQFQPEVLKNVMIFSVFIFPFTLILAIITGVIDGLTRFKTLATPILRVLKNLQSDNTFIICCFIFYSS